CSSKRLCRMTKRPQSSQRCRLALRSLRSPMRISMNRRPVIAMIRRYLSLTALAAVIVLWMLFLRPASLGGPVSYIIIRGSSMLPTYTSGDLIIVRTAPDYRVGDVVAYRVPAGDIGSGLIVIHRIVGSGQSAFTMRGDNNAAIDPWSPRPDDVLGE